MDAIGCDDNEIDSFIDSDCFVWYKYTSDSDQEAKA